MASTEEPVSTPPEGTEDAPPATPIDSTLLPEESKSEVVTSPEAGKENASPASPAKKPTTSTTTKRPLSSSTTTKRPVSSTPTSKTTTPASRTGTSGSVLNKPPTRPTATSTVRKPGSTSTVSHRSRPSISSSADEKSAKGVASSGDEKKGISSAAKRMSLAGTPSTRAPTKPATTGLDRRASVIGSAADKKPSTTTRPGTVAKAPTAVRPSTTTTRTVTRPTTTAAKPAAPPADAKKRLSTIPASKAVDNTAELEKVADLQGKLTESEATIAVLKEELQTVQEKMANFAQSAEEESSKVETATDAIRVEHASKIEQLTLDHKQEIQTLQSQLQEVETKHKELEEKSVQDLEEARKSALDQNDTQTAGVLDELKASHQVELERLQKELADEKAAAGETAAQISRLAEQLDSQKDALEEASKIAEQKEAAAVERYGHLERELNGRDQVVETLRGEQQKLNDAKEKEIAAVKEEASGNASILESKIAELESKLISSENATQQDSEKISKLLLEKDSEIGQQTDVIIAMKAEIDQHKAEIDAFNIQIQELQQMSKDAEDKTKEMSISHDRALAGLRAESDSNTATLTAHHDQELSEAKVALDAANKQLQELRDALDGSAADSQKHINVVNDLKSGHAVELQKLQEKIDASERALADAKSAHEESGILAKETADQEIQVLREKIASVEEKLAAEANIAKSLEADLKAKDEQVNVLQHNLASLEASNQGTSAEQEVALRKLQDQLDAVNISLDEKTREVIEASEKHSSAIETLKADHSTELEKIKSELATSHEEALRSLQTSHDELLSSRVALQSSNAEKIEALQAQLKAAQDEGAAKAAALVESHQAEINKLNKQIEEDQAKLREELESSQASKAAELDSDHSKAIEELLTAHESKIANLRSELEASHNEKVESLQKTHEAALAGLTEQLSKANIAAADTSLVDQLKQQVSELEAKLSEAKAEATALIEENTAKHGEELSKAQQDKAAVEQLYQSASTQLDELQKSLANHETSKTQFESVSKQLSSVEEELAILKSSHQKALRELELVKDHNKAMEDKISTGEKEMNEQISKNMQLLTQLTEVDSSISMSRKRVRELEAELAALKEKDAEDGNPKSAGLAASRWATADEETEGNEGAATEGEELGSSIEGTMASIQEQLKQIRAASDDWYDEHRRIVGELVQVSRGGTPDNSTSHPRKSPTTISNSQISSDNSQTE